jgi:hypothetical protein
MVHVSVYPSAVLLRIPYVATLAGLLGCGGSTSIASATDASQAPSDGAASAEAGDAAEPTDGGTVREGGPSRDGGDAFGDAAVGVPCADTTSCAGQCPSPSQCTVVCLNQGPFADGGGYCSVGIGECPAPGGQNVCPLGSSCANGQPPVNGTNGDYCMRDCTGDGDCRVADGYRCCKGLTHDGKQVCAPSSLCH